MHNRGAADALSNHRALRCVSNRDDLQNALQKDQKALVHTNLAPSQRSVTTEGMASSRSANTADPQPFISWWDYAANKPLWSV